MTDAKQPEALRLADKYEIEGFLQDHRFAQNEWCRQAAAELRRKHARIAELEAQLFAIGAGGVEPLRKRAAPAYPTEGVPAQAGAYAEARECEHCNHVGINDAANGIASCTACKWNGDSPKEDKCPDCEAEGTMTASCPKCHHEYRLIADATLAATQPEAQGMGVVLTDAQIDETFNQMPDGAAGFLKSWGYRQFARAVLAAQAKQGEQP